MGIFSRKGKSSDPRGGAAEGSKSAQSETTDHLKEFVKGREGCEAFIEPATRVTQTTLVVVGGTGEWTRRRVPDAKTAQKLARELGIVAYDVNLSGYPSRMREWSAAQRKKQTDASDAVRKKRDSGSW